MPEINVNSKWVKILLAVLKVFADESKKYPPGSKVEFNSCHLKRAKDAWDEVSKVVS